MKGKYKNAVGWGAAVAKILPGDHIHYVAPSSRGAPTAARLAAIDKANRKRARKLAKARNLAKGNQ